MPGLNSQVRARYPLFKISCNCVVLLYLCCSVVIVLCCYLFCSVIIVLFYVLIVCTVTLPPGVNPIAVDKYIYLTHHHHRVVCLTTGPRLFPKPVLYRERASVSSFNIQYPLVSLRSSSGCLRLLPRLPVTYTLPSILPPMTCFRRQFLRKM